MKNLTFRESCRNIPFSPKPHPTIFQCRASLLAPGLKPLPTLSQYQCFSPYSWFGTSPNSLTISVLLSLLLVLNRSQLSRNISASPLLLVQNLSQLSHNISASLLAPGSEPLPTLSQYQYFSPCSWSETTPDHLSMQCFSLAPGSKPFPAPLAMHNCFPCTLSKPTSNPISQPLAESGPHSFPLILQIPFHKASRDRIIIAIIIIVLEIEVTGSIS